MMISQNINPKAFFVLGEQQEQPGKFRKSHHFVVMKPFQPEKDDTYTLLRYNDFQNLSQYLVSYHSMIQYPYIPQF